MPAGSVIVSAYRGVTWKPAPDAGIISIKTHSIGVHLTKKPESKRGGKMSTALKHKHKPYECKGCTKLHKESWMEGHKVGVVAGKKELRNAIKEALDVKECWCDNC